MKRWSIYIDIEGFSAIFKKEEPRAINLLGKLIKSIWLLGSNVYFNDTQRLFIHQYGDGLVIVSNGYEENLIRPICISIFLMQIMLLNGGTARIGISEGDFSDILGCYPEEVQNEAKRIYRETGCIGGLSVGSGIMHFQQIMGSTFINAVCLNNEKKKGPLLLLDPKLKDRVNEDEIKNIEENINYIEVDWIHSSYTEIDYIYKKLNLDQPSKSELKKYLMQYIENEELPDEWIVNAKALLG